MRNANQESEYNNSVIDGIALRDWLGAAMASLDAVSDLIGLGTLETDFPGIAPFPCSLPRPNIWDRGRPARKRLTSTVCLKLGALRAPRAARRAAPTANSSTRRAARRAQ